LDHSNFSWKITVCFKENGKAYIQTINSPGAGSEVHQTVRKKYTNK